MPKNSERKKSGKVALRKSDKQFSIPLTLEERALFEVAAVRERNKLGPTITRYALEGLTNAGYQPRKAA